MTALTFSLLIIDTLLASPYHHTAISTNVKATATSKVCCIEWLLYDLVNFTTLQSPKIRGFPKNKTWLFIHTVLVNFTNTTFIHTVLVNFTNNKGVAL